MAFVVEEYAAPAAPAPELEVPAVQVMTLRMDLKACELLPFHLAARRGLGSKACAGLQSINFRICYKPPHLQAEATPVEVKVAAGYLEHVFASGKLADWLA
jgi:hypothetical protein